MEFADTLAFFRSRRRCAEHHAQERREHALPGVRAPGRKEHDATEVVAEGGEVGWVAHDTVWTRADELVSRLDRDLETELGELCRWRACASMRGGTRIVARIESTEAGVEDGKAVRIVAAISKIITSQMGY